MELNVTEVNEHDNMGKSARVNVKVSRISNCVG